MEKQQFEKIQKDLNEIKDALQGKMSSQKKWLPAAAVGDLLNIKIRTVYHYCQKGLLHPHKAGGILLFDRSEIEKLIEGK